MELDWSVLDESDESDIPSPPPSAAPPPDPRPSRPDVQKRKADRQELQEHTVQGSLPGRLADDEDFWTPEQRSVLLDLIREQVRNVSEMKVRASFVAHETILTCLRNPTRYKLPELEQSFFYQCLTVSSETKTNSLVKDVAENEFWDYPEIPRMMHDRDALSYAAREMVTVFNNNIKLPFLGRLKGFIATWMRKEGISPDDVSPFDVLATILKWKEKQRPMDEFPQIVRTFIVKERVHLQKQKGEGKTHRNLRYYYRVLELYRSWGVGSGFPLVPVYAIKSHFIGLTTESLCGILRDLQKRTEGPSWLPEGLTIEKMAEIHGERIWRRMFTLDGLVRRRRFNRYIQTDGHTIIVHFVAKKADIEERQRRAKKHKRDGNVVDHVLGFDPGRVNMVAGVEMRGEKVIRHVTLTRGSHYQALRGSIARRKRWDVPLLGVFARLGRGSLRSTCPVKNFEYRRAVIDNYTRLWDNKTSSKRGRERLFAFSKKRSGLDKFFSDLRGDRSQPAPRVVYGGASIRPNGKGEALTVPVKGVLASCKRFFNVEMVNEYLTTKTHAKCGVRMNPIKRRGESRAVRGLCWCPSCKVFVNRDGNAAENMCSLRATGRRPDHLKFGQAKVVMATLPLLPSRAEKQVKYKSAVSVFRKTGRFGFLE